MGDGYQHTEKVNHESDGKARNSEEKLINHTSSTGTRVGHGEHHRIAGERTAHKFPASGKAADSFCGTSKSGQLRVSGKSGAHQIGKK